MTTARYQDHATMNTCKSCDNTDNLHECGQCEQLACDDCADPFEYVEGWQCHDCSADNWERRQ